MQNPESGKATWKPKLRSGKKKKKEQKVCFVKEDLTVKQSANGSDWPMSTVSDSRGKCKEFIVPVTIDSKTVDMKFDTGASVTTTPMRVWTDVLASKPVEPKISSYAVILGTKFLLLEKLRYKLHILTKKYYYWLLLLEMMVLC